MSLVYKDFVNGQTIILAEDMNNIQNAIIDNTEAIEDADVAIGGKQAQIKSTNLTLTVAGWEGSGPFTQAVTITGVTSNTRVDLLCDATTLSQLIADKVEAIYIINNNGTLAAYATGAKPTADITVTAFLTEITSI